MTLNLLSTIFKTLNFRFSFKHTLIASNFPIFHWEFGNNLAMAKSTLEPFVQQQQQQQMKYRYKNHLPIIAAMTMCKFETFRQQTQSGNCSVRLLSKEWCVWQSLPCKKLIRLMFVNLTATLTFFNEYRRRKKKHDEKFLITCFSLIPM